MTIKNAEHNNLHVASPLLLTLVLCTVWLAFPSSEAVSESTGADLRTKLDFILDHHLNDSEAVGYLGDILPDQRVSDEGTTWTASIVGDGSWAEYCFTYRRTYFIILVERQNGGYERCSDIRKIQKTDNNYEITCGVVQVDRRRFESDIVTIYNFRSAPQAVDGNMATDEYINDIVAAFRFNFGTGKIEPIDASRVRMVRGQD